MTGRVLRRALAASLLVVGGVAPAAAAERTHCNDWCPQLDDGIDVLPPAGPNSIAVGAAFGIGILYQNRYDLGISFERLLGRRFEIGAAFRLGQASDLVNVEPSLGVGVLLHATRRWTLAFIWRAGYAAMYLKPAKVWTGALAVNPGIELRLSLSPHWELRLRPLALTGYWNKVWAITVDPGAALAVRF